MPRICTWVPADRVVVALRLMVADLAAGQAGLPWINKIKKGQYSIKNIAPFGIYGKIFNRDNRTMRLLRFYAVYLCDKLVSRFIRKAIP